MAAAAHTKTRIMLIDDHETVRLGLAQVIGNEPRLEVCGQAADAPSALRLLRTVHPDMAIVDLSLQDGNGLELIRQIKASHPDIRMIVLSMHDEELYAERAIRAGALGYVNKHAPAQTIIAAIQAVSAGRLFLSDKITSRMLTKYGQIDSIEERPTDRLSDRELDIFCRIGRGQALEDIAQQLHISIKTVSTYRDRIRAKLNLESSQALVRYACLWVHENT
jgi:DNA-binding NarL/FixJ family response regulator